MGGLHWASSWCSYKAQKGVLPSLGLQEALESHEPNPSEAQVPSMVSGLEAQAIKPGT